MASSGELDRRAVLRSETTADDGAGGQTVTWSDMAELWAGVEALSGREFLQAGALQNAMTHRVTLRWRDDVTIKQRVYTPMDEKTYEVVGIRAIGRKRWLELDVVEVDG